MKLITLALIVVAFLIGYWYGYRHAYQPLYNKLQALQAQHPDYRLPSY